jgi:hypothetical protein
VTETNVFQLSQPGSFADPLTEVLRDGARALLAQAVEAEVAALLSVHADKLTDDGRQRLVRHGHLPEREIMTGIGPVAVRCPRVRDRVGEGSERIRFSSAILPPYARRSKSLEVLIPILYLKGVSTGDFEEALVALLGRRSRPSTRACFEFARLVCAPLRAAFTLDEDRALAGRPRLRLDMQTLLSIAPAQHRAATTQTPRRSTRRWRGEEPSHQARYA